MDKEKKESLTTFYMRIQGIREDADMSQQQVANILRVSRDAYGRYERAERIPPVDFLLSFCNYFNVSADYILGMSNTKNYTQVTITPPSTTRDPLSDLPPDIRKEVLAYAEFKRQQLEKKDNREEA